MIVSKAGGGAVMITRPVDGTERSFTSGSIAENTSWAREAGKMILPVQIVLSVVPRTERGWAWRVSSVTMPKNWPAPRIPQKRSGCEVDDTSIRFPDAVTRRAETTLSEA
jgi:hypothetical protein